MDTHKRVMVVIPVQIKRGPWGVKVGFDTLVKMAGDWFPGWGCSWDTVSDWGTLAEAGVSAKIRERADFAIHRYTLLDVADQVLVIGRALVDGVPFLERLPL